tara:strand:+ start:5109 stop:5813 length:705 start_codon:yes stop_codon:yes gene_type:complete
MSFLKSFVILFFDILDLYHQRKILKFVKNNKIEIKNIIDIGSHKGKYFDLFYKNFNINRAILIEPQIDYFNYLKSKYKNKKKIKIFNNAISSSKLLKYFYINRHDLTSSLNLINRKNNFLKLKSKIFGFDLKNMIKKKVKIRTETLDNLLKKSKVKKIDLVKIDTEGHELEVLRGSKKYIKKFKIILIEFRRDNVYKNYNANKIHRIIIKNNFSLKKIFKFPFTTWEDRIYLQK